MRRVEPDSRGEPQGADQGPEEIVGAHRPEAMLDVCLTQHRQLQYEVSRYIELLLGELLTMARAADLERLQRSLEATRQDAGEQTRATKPKI